MSLVGPRPERPEFIADLSREVLIIWIDQLKPGLTGIAQIVNGYDNNIESFKRKVAYDLYLRNCSRSMTGFPTHRPDCSDRKRDHQ